MSKEMTPKEALNIIQDNLTPRTPGILTVEFNIVEQALDRLEVLEKIIEEYKKLYIYEKVIELQQENEKLKKAIEHEIELLIERRFNSYACDNYEVYNVIYAIIEELKEVFEL